MCHFKFGKADNETCALKPPEAHEATGSHEWTSSRDLSGTNQGTRPCASTTFCQIATRFKVHRFGQSDICEVVIPWTRNNEYRSA